MNSQRYYNNISEKLEVLAQRIKTSGQLNILDLNIHAETFYRDLLNIVYEYNLKSVNVSTSNFEAIDLIDEKNKILFQVTSNVTKQKIETTLKKKSIQEYSKDDYNLKFMFIADDAKKLRNKEFKNPYGIDFCSANDICDKITLLTDISQLTIGRCTLVNDLFEDEFGQKPDPVKVNNNLTNIIKLLAEEDLDVTSLPTNLNYFNIDEKVAYNDLDLIKETTIDEYKVYYNKVDSIYRIFDNEGKNKRISVLRKITSFYEKELARPIKNVDCFFNVINSIEQYILDSKNIEDIDEDILEMCIRIIVVDAFIRCKIFKNPREYSHVITERN